MKTPIQELMERLVENDARGWVIGLAESYLEKEYQMYLQAINSGYHDGYSDGQSHDYGKSLNAEKDFRIIYNNDSTDETNQNL